MSNLPTAEPDTSPMQNSKKMTTPTQKPSHTSAKRVSDKRRARTSNNKVGSRGK
ncbi:hypothetical protein PR003_g21480 [Phytophthora rubi]|uniref:Uncharacterized protein n=1 Tax=Phytophthora rubi TaxID=129364 RepID=A0A6A3LT15_9STRA|nr:hypothetical protein PR002_g16094 [Phytophthora rubi]KAE9022359.1 hypothetical protein PR001_g13161 [Phytophthora rubi]KAE9305495.1 hypothetical protein PR003_g21480 [Phytophthora rubi]